MCEVEFWEVCMLEGSRLGLRVAYSTCLPHDQIGNLEVSLRVQIVNERQVVSASFYAARTRQ
jgi:hypothetical protein